MIKFKNVVIGALVALMAATGILATASSANAYYTNVPSISGGPVTASGVTQFFKQGDGSGVNVANFNINTTAGCGNFESGIKWTGYVGITQSGTTVTSYYDTTSCSFTYVMNREPFPTGAVTVTAVFKARINNSGDKEFIYIWDLYPSGNSVLISTYTRDA